MKNTKPTIATEEDLTPTKLMLIIIQGLSNIYERIESLSITADNIQKKLNMLATTGSLDEKSVKAAIDKLFEEETTEDSTANAKKKSKKTTTKNK